MKKAKPFVCQGKWHGFSMQRGYLYGEDAIGLWIYPSYRKPRQGKTIRIMRPFGKHDVWRESFITRKQDETARQIDEYFFRAEMSRETMDVEMREYCCWNTREVWNSAGYDCVAMNSAGYDHMEIARVKRMDAETVIAAIRAFERASQQVGIGRKCAIPNRFIPSEEKQDEHNLRNLTGYRPASPRSVTIPGLGMLA